MSAKQERNGRKFGEQGRAAVDALQAAGITDYAFTKGKHAQVAFDINGERQTYRFACTPRSAGGAAKTVKRGIETVIEKARGMAAVAAPEKTGGFLQQKPPERHSTMLQESMVLPSADSKAVRPQKNGSLYTDAHATRARRAHAWLVDRLEYARKNGVFSETVELDPVLAELLLTHNPGNRSLRNVNLTRIEEDIRGGRWEVNGESVKVSLDGQLNDGQHRCTGVVNTGMSIRTVITFGLDRKSRLTVDQGANRSAGDYLGMEGIAYANNAAAVAGMIWQIANHGGIFAGGVFRPTKSQVQETFYQHPKIKDSILAVPYKGARLVGGVSTLAFCHYMFALKNRKAADAFVAQLVNGDELKRSDVLYVARAKLMGDNRLRPAEKIEVIFRAWNAVRSGRALKTIPVHKRLPSIES